MPQAVDVALRFASLLERALHVGNFNGVNVLQTQVRNRNVFGFGRSLKVLLDGAKLVCVAQEFQTGIEELRDGRGFAVLFFGRGDGGEARFERIEDVELLLNFVVVGEQRFRIGPGAAKVARHNRQKAVE